MGATVGSLFLASVDRFRLGTRSICACVFGFALFLTLFAFSHSFLLSIAALTMIGFCQHGERALTNTAIQMGTPQNLLGRVLSLFFMDRGLWSLGGLFYWRLGLDDRHRLDFRVVRRRMWYCCDIFVGCEPAAEVGAIGVSALRHDA